MSHSTKTRHFRDILPRKVVKEGLVVIFAHCMHELAVKQHRKDVEMKAT